MHHHLLLLLLVLAVFGSYGEVVSDGLAAAAAAACSTAKECQLVPNAVAMRCTGGECTPDCTPGFDRIGTACVSASLNCGKGQQPHSNGTRCVVCPRNSYKDASGILPCTPCPNGTFTAGSTAQGHDSITKCLAGGLRVIGGGVKAPRVQIFRRHLSAAQRFMHSTAQRGQPVPCRGGCSAALRQLTEPIAYIAASPQVVSPQQRLLRMPPTRPRVQNQGLCATCVNAAITGAAEAAVAAAAGANTSRIAFSSVYGYYCEPSMVRSCASGWVLEDALAGLASATVRFLQDAACAQTVDLEGIRMVAPSQLPDACNAVFSKCSSLRAVSKCTYKALTDFWEMQHAIRVNGAVITRVSVGPRFVEFFQDRPNGVYDALNNQNDSFPHAVILIGYNNTGQYWWAQNSYGTTFANQGVFKLAYGTAFAANPNETFTISCSLAPSYPTNPLKKWPLQVVRDTTVQGAPCYSYTARSNDYLSGVADHFGLDLIQLVTQNPDIFSSTTANKPDLSTSLAGKRLLLCGVTEDLFSKATIECGVGEYQSSSTGRCEVCPYGTYKTKPGPRACRPCRAGTVTTGCSAADHDSPADCTPAVQHLLCEQFIGRFSKSGVYNVTVQCKEYQVYCDMETDGGGWTLFMSYNVAANTFPRETYSRTLADGFPLLSGNPAGVDESGSTGPGGSWGHVEPAVMGQVPNFSEFLAEFETLNPENPADALRAHYKSAEPRTLHYFKTEYLAAPTAGLNLNGIKHTHTPMQDQNGFIPSDGEGKLVPINLWALALAGLPVRHTVYMRGSQAQPPVCEPGWYQKGWSCHICPDHTYKDNQGAGPCSPCPAGEVSGAPIHMLRSPSYHDSRTDCKKGQPDVSWNITRPDGSRWVWEFFWSVRSQPTLAEQVCRLRGGHLVTLESELISTQLAGKVQGDDTGRPSFPILHTLDILWMGLHSPEPSSSRSGPWTWYGGASYNLNSNYTNWANTQPDNFADFQGKDAALLLDSNGLWDDYYRFMYQEFVCERRIVK